MSLELSSATLTEVGVVLVLAERVLDRVVSLWKARRHATGGGLNQAFRTTGGVIDSLFQLYLKLQGTAGFHSLRLVSAHNSGADLADTILWKGTILATFPHAEACKFYWNEQPLDPEYIAKILRPIVTESRRVVRASELSPTGPLGVIYERFGISQSVVFLIKKSDSEIVFATVAFTGDDSLSAEQLDAIRVCESQVSAFLR